MFSKSLFIRCEGKDGRVYDRAISELVAYFMGKETFSHIDEEKADDCLRRYGLRVVADHEDGARVFKLAISNDQQINTMFENTPWADGWFRQLQRIEGAKTKNSRFTNTGRGVRHCVVLPLLETLKLSDDQSDEDLLSIPGFE